MCLWDDRGPKKVHQALEDDILEFIKHAMNVRELFVPASEPNTFTFNPLPLGITLTGECI